ncbi:hypothetical protein ACHAQH_008607 [Verticillium albo-atrum]
MDPEPVHLAQHIVRFITSLTSLTILALSLYCAVIFKADFKLASTTAIVLFVWNTTMFYGHWAHARGRRVHSSIAATNTFPRMIFGDMFIIILGAVSAGLLAAVDLETFHAGAGHSHYKADPWRMVVFGLQRFAYVYRRMEHHHVCAAVEGIQGG